MASWKNIASQGVKMLGSMVIEFKTLNTNLANICSHLRDIHDALTEDEGLISELMVTNNRLEDIKDELKQVYINVELDGADDVADELRRARLERPVYRPGGAVSASKP